MSNRITINFQPCTPTPGGGYIVQYRPVGSTDPYITYNAPFFASPAVFNDGGANPDGTEYEGYLISDCGNGNFGTPVHWSTLECDAVVMPEVEFPIAIVGEHYSHTITVQGSAPFALSNIVKPAWMFINVVGNNINFSGTPTEAGEAVEVSFDISNCLGTYTDSFNEDIEVILANFFVENLTTDPRRFQIDSVSGIGITPLVVDVKIGSYPVLHGERLVGIHNGFPGPFIRIETSATDPGNGLQPKRIQILKNGAVVYSQGLLFGGTFTHFMNFTSVDEIRVRIVHF